MPGPWLPHMIRAQPSAAGRSLYDAADMKLRLGLSGVGAGAMNLLPGFAHSPIVELAAAADLREEALVGLSREFGARTHHSIQELCEDDGIDAIWVATPNQFH